MLPYGCRKAVAELLFPNTYISSDMAVGVVEIGGQFRLTKIAGDCTACVLSMENVSIDTANTIFKNAQALMSVSGRINAFFSKTIDGKDNVSAWINKLKKFNIVGLNVQKSNRDPLKDWWQISGILKCPNPYVRTYMQLDTLPPDWQEWNSQDVTSYNELATLYKCSKLKETNYATV